jgi:hypothetical protein
VADDDDDDGGFFDLNAAVQSTPGGANQVAGEQINKEILKSDTNATEWALEVERVTPTLKIVVRQDAKVRE